jgi:hypothetical protein
MHSSPAHSALRSLARALIAFLVAALLSPACIPIGLAAGEFGSPRSLASRRPQDLYAEVMFQRPPIIYYLKDIYEEVDIIGLSLWVCI